MLAVQLARGSADVVQRLLKARHITLNKGDAQVEGGVCRCRAVVDETLWDVLPLLVYDHVTSNGVGASESEERREED